MFAPLAILLFVASLPLSPSSGQTPNWLGRVDAGEPGAFPPPRSFAATYRVGWSGLDAAQVESRCTSPDGNGNLQLAVQIKTTGLARSLYTLDASHLSVVNRRTLHPIHLVQVEKTSGRRVASQVEFTPQEAVRTSTSFNKKNADGASKPTARHYPFPALYDMNSALLYLRSQPMKNGEERTIALMTANAPYLATIKILGRGRVRVKAGEFPAVECSLALEKVNKNGELEARKRFKTAHAWLSDDADRLLLKVEAQVFIGSVLLELEQVKYSGDNAAH